MRLNLQTGWSYRPRQHAQRGEAGAALREAFVCGVGEAASVSERVGPVGKAPAGRGRQLSQRPFFGRSASRLGYLPASAVFWIRDIRLAGQLLVRLVRCADRVYRQYVAVV